MLPTTSLAVLLTTSLVWGGGACTSDPSAQQLAARADRSAPRPLPEAPRHPAIATPPLEASAAPHLVVLESAQQPRKPTAADLDDSGVVVTVAGEDSGTGSRSIGHPRKGRLSGGVQLKPSKGIRVGWPDRAWATEDAIFDLLDAIDAVRRKHPGAHAVLVGDLSLPRGGPMEPHHSHQTGRDVDIGLYFDDVPAAGLDHFRDFDAGGFDVATTWTLLAALIGPDPTQPRVKDIFLAWEAQELLRAHAATQGVSATHLDLIFQVPRGGGIVRHVEGHRNHMHVRFRCPKGQISCTDLAPETVAYQKVRRKCVKRKRLASAGKRGSKLQKLLAGDSGGDGVLGKLGAGKGRKRDVVPDVHCFIVELE